MSETKRSRLTTIVLIVVVALVAVLVVAEVYIRNRATTCLARSFESELGTNVDVDLSWKPVLLQLLDRQVPSVTFDSDDTAFGPAQEMTVHAEVRDVDLRDDAEGAGTIGSSTAEVTWPTSGILATLQSQPAGSLVTGVTSDDTAGTLTITVGGAGLAEFTAKPVVSDGVVSVDTTEASILGIGLPTALVDGVVDILSAGLQQYPLDMRATDVQVTGEGIELALEGGRFVLPEAPAGQQQQAPEGCGILS